MGDITKKVAVSGVVLAPVVDSWVAKGCPVKLIESTLGKYYPDLRSQWVPVKVVTAMYLAVADALKDPLLGLRTGLEMDLTRMGVMSNLLLYGPSVGTIIKTMMTFNSLLSQAMQFELKEDQDSAILTMDSIPSVEVSYHQEDNFIGAILNLFHTVLPPYTARVFLIHESYGLLKEYEKLSQSYFQFGVQRNQIVFPKSYLNTPVPWHDSRLYETSKKIAQDEFEKLKSQVELPEIVKELIKSRLAHGEPDQGAIAQALDLGVRNFQIKLKEHNVRFRDLVSECRKEMALDLVKANQYSSQEIALMLGYTDTVTYYRAFKRWTGLTVLDYLDLHQS